MSKTKTKEVRKTPEQIMAEIKKQEESNRQRKFVKEVLYPYLLANSKSVADAKTMLKGTVIGMQQAFNNLMVAEQERVSKLPVSFLEMEKFVQEGKDAERFKGLLDLIKDETIGTASGLLDGMETTIAGFEKEESTKKELSSLPATLLDPK